MPISVEDGSYKVYREIYQETSSGDFGIQVTGGPLFRCHTYILGSNGGFLSKIRRFGKVLSREVDVDAIPQVKEYFKQKGYTRLLNDLAGIQFSQDLSKSALKQQNLISAVAQHADPLKPGYTTAHFIGGTTAAVKNVNPYFLAERYEVECDCERMAELLRFIYQGVMSFFEAKPKTDKEREMLTHKMLNICMDAERYSVDALFEKLLYWFGKEAYWVVGERHFADAFYYLEHYILQCTEEHSRNYLKKTVTGDMLANREQFCAVTRDDRWASLPVEFVEKTLRYDGMPIGSETEVLMLISRWNKNADKKKEELVQLLTCFRPEEETREILVQWLTNMGWLDGSKQVPQVPELKGVARILDGTATRGLKPRKNLQGSQLLEAQKLLMQESGEDEEPTLEEEASFLHYKGSQVVNRGSQFNLGAKQRLVQMDAIRTAGIQRFRMVLSNPRKHLWDPEHEVFTGVSYGEGKYFGYLVSASAFSGIFAARALASAAPAPNAPVHLTGSGNKVEFDLALEVQLHRANLVVTCKLSVIFANETLTEELFQVSYDTLMNGPGLRFQVVGTGLGDEVVDVQLSWVSGGGAADEKEVSFGPLGFVDGD